MAHMCLVVHGLMVYSETDLHFMCVCVCVFVSRAYRNPDGHQSHVKELIHNFMMKILTHSHTYATFHKHIQQTKTRNI